MSERASRAAAAKRAKERGGELYAQKRWDDAIGAFGEAIAVAPKDDEDVAPAKTIFLSSRSIIPVFMMTSLKNRMITLIIPAHEHA